MKVHTRSGRVEFERGSVEPQMNRHMFLQSGIGKEARVLVQNEPHITYGFRPERGIAAAASFDGTRLKRLSWQLELTADKEKAWNEANELERKRLHDEWLNGAIGKPPYCFQWGRLESEYDSKGCASSIIVSYAD